MFAANAYRIRFSDGQDADALTQLAESCTQRPLVGRVLIGEIDGAPAAAISVTDGRVVADSFNDMGRLVATLHMRAAAIRAYEATPSLRERLLAALPKERGKATVTPMPASRDAQAIERVAA